MVAFRNLRPLVEAGDAEAVAAEEGDGGFWLGSSVVFLHADVADVVLGLFIYSFGLGSSNDGGFPWEDYWEHLDLC